MTAIRPMLAAKLDWNRLQLPAYVSPKIDGVRAVILDGKPLSRTAKVLPNRHFQRMVYSRMRVLEGLDGEVVVGPPTDKEVYNRTMSGVMSAAGQPHFKYLIFDTVAYPNSKYWYRLKKLLELADKLPPWTTVLPQVSCHSRQEVEDQEFMCLQAGYEGVIVRSPEALYKFGRSTVNEGGLLKLKRYEDAEATIIGFDELMHNENVAQTDVQGLTRRTSHKENQRAGGVLGAFVCRLVSAPNVVFGVGTGFDFAQREEFWARQEELLGKVIIFKHMPHGALASTGVPRHPVFKAFRDPIDM